MVKKILLLAVLALALPMAAFASSTIDFTNSGGTLTGSSSGVSLSSSTLVVVKGFFGGTITGTNLGSVSFTTGALTSGSLSGDPSAAPNATFAGGGSFTITGNGVDGIPSGVIFSGTFSGPVTLTGTQLANGTWSYTLSGPISGKLYTGFSTVASTVQLVFSTHKGPLANGGSATISSGDSFVVVPEPGTLSLFGTGLIGLAGLVRRKLNLI
jgi:fibronectin-binding autotransporter adhesin